MPVFASSTFRFVPFALVALVGGAIVLAFLLTGARESFPTLPGGSYIGNMQGISEKADETVVLYAERIAGAQSLLLLPFREGWKPIVVPLAGNSTKGSDPLQFSYDGVNYWLTGKLRSDEFVGEVRSSAGQRGTWRLRPVSPAAIRQPDTAGTAQVDLRNWLRTKMRFQQFKQEFDSIQEARAQLAVKQERLERFVKDEDVLRDRSKSRRDALAQEINKVAEQRKKSTQELREAVNDIGVVTRITQRGQVVELARRISRRENKWYNVNWTATGDTPGNAEEQFAEQEQVDLSKLNLAVKRAEEVERLKKTLSDETSRIQWLEAEYRERNRIPDVLPPMQDTPPLQRESERPWWKKINPF